MGPPLRPAGWEGSPGCGASMGHADALRDASNEALRAVVGRMAGMALPT